MLLENKISYNGFAQCYSTLVRGKKEATPYSRDNHLYLRCQQPCEMKWWYFACGEEVDADSFYNN